MILIKNINKWKLAVFLIGGVSCVLSPGIYIPLITQYQRMVLPTCNLNNELFSQFKLSHEFLQLDWLKSSFDHSRSETKLPILICTLGVKLPSVSQKERKCLPY